jgi:hypothetical protein
VKVAVFLEAFSVVKNSGVPKYLAHKTVTRCGATAVVNPYDTEAKVRDLLIKAREEAIAEATGGLSVLLVFLGEAGAKEAFGTEHCVATCFPSGEPSGEAVGVVAAKLLLLTALRVGCLFGECELIQRMAARSGVARVEGYGVRDSLAAVLGAERHAVELFVATSAMAIVQTSIAMHYATWWITVQ